MEARHSARRAAATIVGLALGVLPVAGAVVAVAGHRIGLFVALGAVGVSMALHLVQGVASYRHVMNRPWPQVPPLDDDDEW